MSRRSAHNLSNGTSADRGADWRHDAVCRDHDPETWFPVGTSGPAMVQTDEAKAICRTCPVIDDCLAWALDSGQDAGVWGGMSEAERRAVKRRGGLRVLRAAQ
ncbi:WhiB family transcriptional regulator [Micromonospora tulbaghiae]|uniref:WhiB family transcriptional regulator n=1 Tax=Micromonospora tulbaghiae TaxID=479978 RepID=UPI0033F232C3